MILTLALIVVAAQILALFYGAYLAWARNQRDRRSAEIRRELAQAEAVRIDDALTIGSARRGPDLPSIKRTVP